MSAETQANGIEVPSFKIVSRLDQVPVIHDSVAYAQSLIQSTQTTSQLYGVALAIASKSYDIATPVLTRTKPILETADGLAVATVDRTEAIFPYPFKTPTEDLIVVKQAKGVYDTRIAPWVQSAQPVLADVINRTSEINAALGARAQATVKSSQDLSHALLEQLKALTAQGQGIPGHLMESVSKTTGDVKQIIFNKDASLQDKSNALGAYVVDQVKPVVDQVYDYVLGAKKRAEKEGEKVVDAVTDNNGVDHSRRASGH